MKRLKKLMKELGEAINDSLSDSDEAGGGAKCDDGSAGFQMTSQDLKFLKSMRIAVEHDK